MKFSFFKIFRKLLYYGLLLMMSLNMFSSCGGGPKKSASIRKIERKSRRNPAPTDMDATAKVTSSRKIKQAVKKRQKREKAEAKAFAKAQSEGYKRHREMQTKETRERMDASRKKSEKVNKSSGLIKQPKKQKRKTK